MKVQTDLAFLRMKSKEDLDLIASAAAKLALQQLDPAAKRKRQEFTSGLPQGLPIFALCVTQVRILEIASCLIS